jgi:hypothetical protein
MSQPTMTSDRSAQPERAIVLMTPPGAAARWMLLGAGWSCVVASLFMDAGNRNGFMRWRYDMGGVEFQGWLLVDLPRWVVRCARRGEWGYIPLMDLVWLAAALAASAIFLASPLIFSRVRRPATLLVTRYLALALLTFPITAFLPVALRYPIAHAGLWALASGHLLVLIGLWSPWPVLMPSPASFEVQLMAQEKRT